MNQGRNREAPQSPGDRLGKVLLISSGETAASGHEMHQRMLAALAPPIRAAILETPAGFELNSPLVAQRVGDFLKASLSNFSPSVAIIPARRRDGPFSTDDPELLAPLLELIQEREAARQAHDWPVADALRQRVAEMGFEIQDTGEGPRWRYKGVQRKE